MPLGPQSLPYKRTRRVAEVVFHRHGDARDPVILQFCERDVGVAFGERRVEVIRRIHVAAPRHFQAHILLIIAEILNVFPLDFRAEIVDRIHVDAVARPQAQILRRAGKKLSMILYPARARFGEQVTTLATVSPLVR